jgi:hypothetical protein
MKTTNETLSRYINLFKLASTLKAWNKHVDDDKLSELLLPIVDKFSLHEESDNKNKLLNASLCQYIIDDKFDNKQELFNYINNIEIYKPR